MARAPPLCSRPGERAGAGSAATRRRAAPAGLSETRRRSSDVPYRRAGSIARPCASPRAAPEATRRSPPQSSHSRGCPCTLSTLSGSHAGTVGLGLVDQRGPRGASCRAACLAVSPSSPLRRRLAHLRRRALASQIDVAAPERIVMLPRLGTGVLGTFFVSRHAFAQPAGPGAALRWPAGTSPLADGAHPRRTRAAERVPEQRLGQARERQRGLHARFPRLKATGASLLLDEQAYALPAVDLGQRPPLTFAYPCGAGEATRAREVATQCGAREATSRPRPPRFLDRFVPRVGASGRASGPARGADLGSWCRAVFSTGRPAAGMELVARVEDGSVAQGGGLVLGSPTASASGDHLSVSQEAHEVALLPAYLAPGHRDRGLTT